MMNRNLLRVIDSKILICCLASTVVGCSAFEDFKKIGSQLTPSQQVVKPKMVAPKKKTIVKKMNHDCSYIVRDLSSHNAKDVWCVPRAYQ